MILEPQRTQRSAEREFPLSDITSQIISCAIEVHSSLGPGLLESIYEEAIAHEFSLRRILFEKQKDINLKYKGKGVGKHRVDFLIDDEIIVELRAVDALHKIHEAQLMTYLKAMNKRVGLLIKFNVEKLKDGIRRFII